MIGEAGWRDRGSRRSSASRGVVCQGVLQAFDPSSASPV